ncbi:MAG: NusG domain II-containing protein [Clostridiales bacterium]|nr:NusG domain II-containing protein [Clostridiales bacterium]
MKKADFVLIGVVAVVAAVLLIFLYGVNNSSDGYVQIEIDGEVTETLPLDEDAERDIETEYGKNTLVIKDGSAEMTYADCPDGICTNHNAISRNGESIICLPHKVVVTIVSEAQEDDVDAVA